MYATIRNLHLLFASIALPFLLMYGISAVQMSHDDWFKVRPIVTEQTLALTPARDDARAVAREVMERLPSARGELQSIQTTPSVINLRIYLPGTLHEVRYERATGTTHVRLSATGVMGMLNRLHHAAGLPRGVTPLNVWGGAVAAVSLTLMLVGATGLWMWFLRRTERLLGAVLLGVDLAFALVLIVLIRQGGP